MIKSWYLSFSFLLLCLLSGCSRRGLRRMLTVPRTAFTAEAVLGTMKIRARICTHAELQRYFSLPQDMYHYYHLMHIRLENQSYVRYTLQADKCSFFVPPDSMLRKYTRSNHGSYGALISFMNAVLFLPIYIISMFKAAVESPPYLMNPDLVVPKPFGLLSGVYAAVTLGPFILTKMAENSTSDTYFTEANKLILTQRKQLSISPYKSIDTLILTPRAGFVTPCALSFYNHKIHESEAVELPVRMVY